MSEACFALLVPKGSKVAVFLALLDACGSNDFGRCFYKDVIYVANVWREGEKRTYFVCCWQ